MAELSPLQIVEGIADEAIRRMHESAAAKGGKLTASERTHIKAGARIGAALAFQMVAEASQKKPETDGG